MEDRKTIGAWALNVAAVAFACLLAAIAVLVSSGCERAYAADGSPELSIRYDPASGTVSYEWYSASAVNATRVQAPTWSSNSYSVQDWGNHVQDDIQWYSMTKSGDKWTCSFPLSNHYGFSDHYVSSTFAMDVHFYAFFGDEAKMVRNASYYIPGITTVDVVPSMNKQSSSLVYFDLQSRGKMRDKIVGISSGTWSENNGQDDLTWYDFAPLGGYRYRATVPTPESGWYTHHFYIQTNMRSQEFLTGYRTL